MGKGNQTFEIFERLGAIPILDAHTHLVGGKMGARGLHDILLYHMAVSDLYAAGCPSGARLTQYPEFPTKKEAHARIKEALPYLNKTRNTAMSWLTRIILKDLYDWTEPISETNWQKIDGIISERADNKSWQREIAKRAGIKRFVTEYARMEGGKDSDLLQYALEWAFFTRCQWGEYDTALYELEKCWGKTPSTPTPIGTGKRPPVECSIKSLDDVHEAIDHYVNAIPYKDVLATATHISTDIDYSEVSDKEMAEALKHRKSAGQHERDIYASYINEAFLTRLEQHSDEIVFQFSLGAEPLPYETASRLSQKTIAQLADMISRHKKLRFMCFLSSRHANQSLCTMCRELPNLSLAGYWWHNFFPSSIRQVMEERLEMLPVNRQVGFFSDAYCLEVAYGKSVIVRKQLAEVLARKIEQGQYGIDDALSIAKLILFETPQELLGIRQENVKC
jgi:glucuronate isomerase